MENLRLLKFRVRDLQGQIAESKKHSHISTIPGRGNQKEDVTDTKENLQAKTDSLDEETGSLNRSLQQCKAEKKQLEKSLESANKQIHESENCNQQLRTELESIKNRFTEVKSKKDKLQAELDEAVKEKDDLQTHIAAYENEQTNLRKHIEIASKKLHESENCNQQLKTAFESMKNGFTEMKSEKGKLQAELDETVKEKDLFQIRIAAYENEQTKLRTHIENACKKRICILGVNQVYLQPITGALHNMKAERLIPVDVDISEMKLHETLSISEDVLEGAAMIILVAIPEPRNMLISESEPSQLGVIFRAAMKMRRQVFMVYAGSKYEDSLKDNQAFHTSLKNLFESQNAVGELAQRNRFISVKVKEGSKVQKLTTAQINVITSWIKECSGH